jgi:hypothetical protein
MNNNRAVYSFCYYAWKERDAYLRVACCVVHREISFVLRISKDAKYLALKSLEKLEHLLIAFFGRKGGK